MEPWQLEPARDTGLTPAERFRSVRRESGLLESLAQQACFSTLRFYFAIVHRLTIMGRDKLPPHGPFILAANHCSHLDALILGAALKARHRERTFLIAAGDIFFQTTVVSVFSAIMLNALPMWRKKLRSACSCRTATQIAGRKSDLHHLPGRRTHAHRFNDAFQARTRHACRGNKCAGCPLRSFWKL